MFLSDRPVRKSRGTVPQRYRELSVPDEMPKTGSAYFKVVSESEDGQIRAHASPVLVERTQARTRDHTEHPGYKSHGSKRLQMKGVLSQRLPESDSEDSSTISSLDIEMQVDQGNIPTLEETTTKQGTRDLTPSYSSIEIKTKRTYDRVMPQDGSELIPLTEEELASIKKIEEKLEQVLLKQAQWKIHMADLDKKIQAGIENLEVYEAGNIGNRRPGIRPNTRGANIDYLMFSDMNANIAMTLTKGVLNRKCELEEEGQLG